MQTELINFKTEDNVILNGFIIKNNSKKIVIATHGMSSNCFKNRDKVIYTKLQDENIDFFGYNNRGSELVKYIQIENEDGIKKALGGTTYEDVLDGYKDIKAAINKAIDLGYEEIFLQGHSLGCTKTVYTYNKLKEENSNLLNYIKGIILLSLVDIPRALQIFLNDKYFNYLKLAEEKESKNDLYSLMPLDSFIHPISVKSFLRYIKYNKDFDFAKYNDKDFKYEKINEIDVPIFMRWGNDNEMIEQNAEDLVNMLNDKIKNSNKDINYIDGANHGYAGKEEILASEIINFLNKI
jgi:hypothetical protein